MKYQVVVDGGLAGWVPVGAPVSTMRAAEIAKDRAVTAECRARAVSAGVKVDQVRAREYRIREVQS